MPSASVLLPADPVLLLFAAPSSAAARGAAAYPAPEASQAPVGASGVVEVVLERLDGAVPVGRGHCEDDAVVDAAGSAGLLAGLERRFRAASGDVDAEAAFAGVEASSELRLGRALEDDAGADVEVLGFGDVVFRAELADAGHVEGALVDALDAFVEVGSGGGRCVPRSFCFGRASGCCGCVSGTRRGMGLPLSAALATRTACSRLVASTLAPASAAAAMAPRAMTVGVSASPGLSVRQVLQCPKRPVTPSAVFFWSGSSLL